MAGLTSNAFLPSGAIENFRTPVFGHRNTSSPPIRKSARSLPECVPLAFQRGSHVSPYHYAPSQKPSFAQHHDSSAISPYSIAPTQSNNGPILPPFSRNASTEDSKALLIEDWRSYSSNLRELVRGERAHFVADRDRMDEVMAEERVLWDKEREDMSNTIRSLRLEVEKLKVELGRHGPQHGPIEPSTFPPRSQDFQVGQRPLYKPTSAASSQSGGSNSMSKFVPQESGRNPDGSRFYAPAPENPTRIFEDPQNCSLRVDNMYVLRATPLRITSKTLTQADFGIPSPKESREGSVVGDAIDISYIRPDLEGVPIKATAVSPTFAAKVLSPRSLTSSGASSSTSPPLRGDNVRDNGGHRNSSQEKKPALEVMAEPENRRLTLNAGHTPNHSATTFDFRDSGSATPTQNQQHAHHTSMVPEAVRQLDGNVDADPELQGPLGLRNDPPKDALFLAALNNKLNEVKESGMLSPSEASIGSEEPSSSWNNDFGSMADGDEDNKSDKSDDGPRLRMKPSINFGRPFGIL